MTARRGMTLIEMLVAMAATLLLMAAVAQAFSIFGKGISGSRSALDTAGRMRVVAWRLRQDLEGATAPTLPPLNPADELGYFEIIEGPRFDRDAGDGSNILSADIDDVLLFTTRSSGTPFRGKFKSKIIESDVAEVAWFARPSPNTNPQTYTLYRKQLLVLGYVGAGEFETSLAGGPAFNRLDIINDTPLYRNNFAAFYDDYDLSVTRRLGLGGLPDYLVPNSLGDLSQRESRFLHNARGDTTGGVGDPPRTAPIYWPFWFIERPSGATAAGGMPHQQPTAPPGLIFDAAASSTRVGEDVVLTNVIAFDVRVFDPAAPLWAGGGEVITPGDSLAPPPPPGAYGAYVDLGNAGGLTGPPGFATALFQGAGDPRSGLNVGTAWVYDTWSLGYEADGVDQDLLLNPRDARGPDQGMDGQDSTIPPDGVIDDVGERETSPPYPYPLRGLEIRIRCYEPTSRQVRQVTVRHTFVPH